MKKSLAAVDGWLFARSRTEWVTVLRVGLGVQVVSYVFTLRDDWVPLLTKHDGRLSLATIGETFLSVRSQLIPRVSWFVDGGAKLGLREVTTLNILWWVLLTSGFLLIAGLFCRPAAVVGWLLHLAACKTGDFFAYGLDSFLTFGLFFLMFAPLPDVWSVDSALFMTRRRRDGSVFILRTLQLQLCVIYFFSGLTKCLGAGWWNGDSIWRALLHPPFDVLSPEFILHFRALLPLAGISVCVIETGFPFLIWPRRTRFVWLGLAIALHVGIGFAMGMYLFALIMITLDLAAFGSDRTTSDQPTAEA